MTLRIALACGTAALALAGAACIPKQPAPCGGLIESNAQKIVGTACADKIIAGPDVEEIRSLGGSDVVIVKRAVGKPVYVDLGDGDDRLESRRVGSWNTYRGGSGNDVLETFALASDGVESQSVEGNDGNDTISVSGEAWVDGNEGNDQITLRGGPEANFELSAVDAGPGNDVIDTRQAAAHSIKSGDLGGVEHVPLYGGTGDDTFHTAQGAGTDPEEVIGQEGTDSANVDPQDKPRYVEQVTVAP